MVVKVFSYIKYINILLIFIVCLLIGKYLSKKYKQREEELEEIKVALNLFKTKIKFTHDTLPEVFYEISQKIKNPNIKNIFFNISEQMKEYPAEVAWENEIEKSNSNLNVDDKNSVKTLSKLLGQLDLEGQIGRIEITEELIQKQIKEALFEKNKNEKLYRTASEE